MNVAISNATATIPHERNVIVDSNDVMKDVNVTTISQLPELYFDTNHMLPFFIEILHRNAKNVHSQLISLSAYAMHVALDSIPMCHHAMSVIVGTMPMSDDAVHASPHAMSVIVGVMPISHDAILVSPPAMVNGSQASMHEGRDGRDICAAHRLAFIPFS